MLDSVERSLFSTPIFLVNAVQPQCCTIPVTKKRVCIDNLCDSYIEHEEDFFLQIKTSVQLTQAAPQRNTLEHFSRSSLRTKLGQLNIFEFEM